MNRDGKRSTSQFLAVLLPGLLLAALLGAALLSPPALAVTAKEKRVTCQFGATDQSGLQTGNDTAVDGGRPMWPVLYLTDISFDKYDRSGDWQSGSTIGIPADQVCGVWTTGVRRVYTHLGNAVTIAMDPSPSPNNWGISRWSRDTVTGSTR